MLCDRSYSGCVGEADLPSIKKNSKITNLNSTVRIEYETFPFYIITTLLSLFDIRLSERHTSCTCTHTLQIASTHTHTSVVNRQKWWETFTHRRLNNLPKKPQQPLHLMTQYFQWVLQASVKIFTVMNRIASVVVEGMTSTNVACCWV